MLASWRIRAGILASVEAERIAGAKADISAARRWLLVLSLHVQRIRDRAGIAHHAPRSYRGLHRSCLAGARRQSRCPSAIGARVYFAWRHSDFGESDYYVKIFSEEGGFRGEELPVSGIILILSLRSFISFPLRIFTTTIVHLSSDP